MNRRRTKWHWVVLTGVVEGLALAGLSSALHFPHTWPGAVVAAVSYPVCYWVLMRIGRRLLPRDTPSRAS